MARTIRNVAVGLVLAVGMATMGLASSGTAAAYGMNVSARIRQSSTGTAPKDIGARLFWLRGRSVVFTARTWRCQPRR